MTVFPVILSQLVRGIKEFLEIKKLVFVVCENIFPPSGVSVI